MNPREFRSSPLSRQDDGWLATFKGTVDKNNDD